MCVLRGRRWVGREVGVCKPRSEAEKKRPEKENRRGRLDGEMGGGMVLLGRKERPWSMG